MNRHRTTLISILMESPLYLTMSVEERRGLLSRLESSYPFLSQGEEDEIQLGYEASWAQADPNH